MEVRTICVQPVRMNVGLYEHLMVHKNQYETVFDKGFDDAFESNWLQAFRSRNRKFRCWKSVKQSSNVSNELLFD